MSKPHKIVARRAFNGLEGQVHTGQILDPAVHETLTPARISELKRNGLVEDYSDKMKANPRNRMLRPHRDPPGMTSPNAGGIVDLGWKPGEKEDETGSEGNDQGQGGGQDGSSTSQTLTSSSSPAGQAQPTRTSQPPAPGRRQRGQRPAS